MHLFLLIQLIQKIPSEDYEWLQSSSEKIASKLGCQSLKIRAGLEMVTESEWPFFARDDLSF